MIKIIFTTACSMFYIQSEENCDTCIMYKYIKSVYTSDQFYFSSTCTVAFTLLITKSTNLYQLPLKFYFEYLSSP